jgi:phage baseplate assembly protein W
MNIPVDIAFPYRIDTRGRSATADGDAHIRDMIEQVLFTAAGERVNRPDFGSGLRQLVFAPNSPELASTLQFGIEAALQRYLGDLIDVQQLEVTADDALLRVTIAYLILRGRERRTDTFVQAQP